MHRLDKLRLFPLQEENFYLSPLPATQRPAAERAALLEPGRQKKPKTTTVGRRHEQTGQRETIALGYDYEVPRSGEINQQPVTVTERPLVVRSLKQGRAEVQSLRAQRRQAQRESSRLGLCQRGKHCPQTMQAGQTAVGKIIQKHHVSGLLEVAYEVTQTERTIRGRGERPTRTDLTATLTPQVSVDKEAVAWACFQKGWRVYATTAPVEKRSLERAVLAYRGLYLIERGFRRLKRQSLALTPMYLKAPTHLTGLSRALRIGRRVLGLLDYKARQALAVAGETMAGLTQGLPKKATATPTAQALLTAVDAISLFPAGGHGYLTPLTGVQRQVLKVLGFSEKIYHCLAAPFLETQLKIRET